MTEEFFPDAYPPHVCCITNRQRGYTSYYEHGHRTRQLGSREFGEGHDVALHANLLPSFVKLNHDPPERTVMHSILLPAGGYPCLSQRDCIFCEEFRKVEVYARPHGKFVSPRPSVTYALLLRWQHGRVHDRVRLG
eukprot:4735690-Pleurochrysis_carterae.AAC.2